MHTALRLGLRAAEEVRALNPTAHICFYGLYAWLNADYLLSSVADFVIAGEYEAPLVKLVNALSATEPEAVLSAIPGVSTRDHREPPYAAVILDGRVEEVTGRSLYDDVRRMAVAYYGEAEGVAFAERYRGDRPDIAHFRIVPDRIVHQRS